LDIQLVRLVVAAMVSPKQATAIGAGPRITTAALTGERDRYETSLDSPLDRRARSVLELELGSRPLFAHVRRLSDARRRFTTGSVPLGARSRRSFGGAAPLGVIRSIASGLAMGRSISRPHHR